MRHASMVAALTVFLAFPAGRLVGLLVDGVPSASVVGALAVEMAIAALCLFAFRYRFGRLALEDGRARAASPSRPCSCGGRATLPQRTLSPQERPPCRRSSSF
jgi:hypothetical protein